ncbi:hypothetical protein MVEN_01743900 [Mycena venus]|uniref:Uncharacterized protein n=1 Tax=Mycena venus TaxID=2733690 RepID=A0A8H7CMF1_9AGAR|nr:hypothetical protein MVEN_01743900 [Mycena venus]
MKPTARTMISYWWAMKISAWMGTMRAWTCFGHEDQLSGDEQDDEGTYPTIDLPRPDSADLAHNLATADKPRKRPRATVEEVEDEHERWFQPCPKEWKAGDILDECKMQFEKLRDNQKKKGHAPWEPFESEDEWKLARWLMTSGLSNKKTDEYLKLKTVRDGINPSFHNSRAFLKRIDALEDGPKWTCYPFKLIGDELDSDGSPKTEIVEMWCRDPVECVQELVENAAFTKQAYEPYRIFRRFVDGRYSNREFNEMWTADWWWEIQKLLPKGATLVPIILASDKTQLTRFSGDQQTWPVYLTIGNIDKETRRRPSSRATVLLGYIPIAKLEIFLKKKRSAVGHQLKHIVDSIRSRGTADGFNTEGTERLHIDLAKVGYNASNKKAYTRQMTLSPMGRSRLCGPNDLCRWRFRGGGDEGEEDVEDHDHDADDIPDDSDDEGELDKVPSLPSFTLAKKPAFPSLTVASIITDFHAPGFINNLAHFLQSKSIVPRLIPADNSTFPVYKRLSVSLPRIAQANSSSTHDTIRAVKGSPLQMTAKGVKPAKAGQFDTVLVRVSPRQLNEGPTDGEPRMTCSVSQLRTKFTLEASVLHAFGSFSASQMFGPYPDPVAYVDWYKPLQAPVTGLGMHQVSLSSHNHRQRSSIIPLSDILRSCHLIPVFGKSADHGWTSDTALDCCKYFYLNPYLRHHDFYLFRYLVAIHDSRKAAKERRVRMRTFGRAGH